MLKSECDHYFIKFKAFAEATSAVSDVSWDLICKKSKVLSVEKGEYLLAPNSVEEVFRFLNEGVVKCEDTYGGKTFVYDFRVAPIVITESVSLVHNTPSRMGLIAVTPCVFIEIPKAFFLDQFNKCADVLMFGFVGIVNYLGMMFYKNAMLRTMSAKERYKQFLIEYPSVARYAKIEDVASYINVTPQSLSRIRKQVEWGEKETHLKVLSNELDVVNDW